MQDNPLLTTTSIRNSTWTRDGYLVTWLEAEYILPTQPCDTARHSDPITGRTGTFLCCYADCSESSSPKREGSRFWCLHYIYRYTW
jgi:hypothetical protein